MSLPAERRRAAVQALFLVSCMRAVLSVFPFRAVLRIVNRLSSPGEAPARGGSGGEGSTRFDRDIAVWAISAAGRLVARRNPCLPEALAAFFLFRRARVPAELHLGVARDESGSLRAHAWVESDGEIVIGGGVPVEEYARLPRLEPRQL